MRRLSAPWWADLAAVVALALVGVVVTLVPVTGTIRAVVMLPFLLILSGYAVTCAIFLPGEIGRDLRLALSVAFSVGIAAIGGLVVELFLRLDRPVWVTLLVLVTVAASFVALRRRDAMPAETQPPTLRIPIVGVASLLAMLAAVGIGGWAIAIATEGAHRQASQARFTSLWLVPDGPARTARPMNVGVTNHEGRVSTYHLAVRQGKRTIRRWRLTLTANESWQAEVPGLALPGSGPVVARLDRDGGSEHRATFRPGDPG